MFRGSIAHDIKNIAHDDEEIGNTNNGEQPENHKRTTREQPENHQRTSVPSLQKPQHCHTILLINNKYTVGVREKTRWEAKVP